ncbi:hypothetical protein COHA_004215 [Chlorella ohadii]|uniref:3-oxo-5-alpha-steroid 4-dehydrogenase C-terminal domain-containing protein n=1 Tax=Chlorella ohadii TaxID=2649997 RepID=A0AAD5H2Q6_9CHLO|nr:hypothetical protein COHA_004215 [Chlorella ohadii]
METLRVLAQAAWALPTSTLAWGMIAAGAATFVALLGFPSLTAPYGRYSKSGWGLLIPSKLAWVTQEMWSFVVPATWLAFFATPDQLARLSAPANALLMTLFLVHYFNRDFIFPLRLRGGKPTPFTVWLMAAVFCIYNGYMQTKYLLVEAPTHAPLTPRVLAGAALWLAGWLTNMQADHILINLRKPGETGYKIPRGGAFEYIMEWSGFALAAWPSLPATAFALFTFCNLAPRGWRHHQWYKRRFPRYPKGRRAIIPFVW